MRNKIYVPLIENPLVKLARGEELNEKESAPLCVFTEELKISLKILEEHGKEVKKGLQACIRNDRKFETIGICGNLWDSMSFGTGLIVDSFYLSKIVMAAALSWEHFTGITPYPVPLRREGNCSFDKLRETYMDNKTPLWKGEHGELRLELVGVCLTLVNRVEYELKVNK